MKYTHARIIFLFLFLFIFKNICSQEMIADVTMRQSGKGKAFGEMLYEKRKKEFKFAFTGQVEYQSAYDMRQIIGASEDAVVIYPAPQNIDDAGIDIYSKDQFSMIGVNASGKTLFVGPDMWGGKLVGRFEWGFGGLGRSGTVELMNIKNAYISLLWRNTEVRFGHYFHPIALTTTYVTTVGPGQGLGFDPNRKAPMVRIIHVVRDKFKILMAAAKIFNSEEARWAVLPDLHLQLDFRYSADYLYGAGIDYHVEVPRIKTDLNYKTEESVGSIVAFLFARIVPRPFLIKTRLSYVENGKTFGIMGTYGVRHRNPVTDERLYTPMRAITYWTDIVYLGNKKFEPGLFVGLAKGLGASRRIVKSYIKEPEEGSDEEPEEVSLINIGDGLTNAAYMFNISPRLRMRYKNLILGFEIEYFRALFARDFEMDGWQKDFNCYGKVINGRPTSNVRVLFSSSYTF